MTTANPPPGDLVLELLKRIHADLSDVKRDLRDLKSSSSMQLTMIGELVKGTARGDERFATLEARIERIEHRLDLHE